MNAPFPTRSKLTHHFVPGLRFDTNLEVLDTDGIWQPWFPEESDCSVESHSVSEWFVAQQTVRILTGQWPVLSEQTAATAHPAHCEAWLQQQLPHHCVQAPQANWPLAVQQCFDGGGMALLCLALPGAVRWMLVPGIEVSGDQCLCSLLTLDPALPAPWACGYNVRLSLAQPAAATPAPRENAHPPVTYRTCDGNRLTGRVEKVLAITPRFR